MNTKDDKTYYETTKDFLETDDHIFHTTYGIRAYKMHHETKTVIDEISDVSEEYEFVNNLTEQFNELDLHIEHFRDVVYDSVDA